MFFVGLFWCAMLWGAGNVSAGEQYWQSLRLRDHPLVGTVWQVSGGEVSFPILFQAASEAHFVLIGEKHDNPDHHAMQAAILKALLTEGRRPSVIMEMIPTDLQVSLDNYLKSEVPNSAALGAVLRWEERGWPRWSFYEPIAELIMANDLALYGGDLPSSLLRTLVDGGLDAIPNKQVKRLSLEVDRGASAEESLLKLLYVSHCRLVPTEALGPMAEVQRARDGSLARTLIKESDGKGAVLIAGNGHVRNDWGVPFLLENEKPGKSRLTIGILEVEEGALNPGDYAAPFEATTLPFDYVVFTPAGEDVDYCARFAEQN